MSIDVFFQPVDLKQWEAELFPYLRGVGSLDGLLAEAERQQRLHHFVYHARSAVIPHERDPSYPDWYDHDLMIWFRPFFAVGRDAEEVARLIAAYRRATPAEAVELVREEVRRIAPGRADAVRMPADPPPDRTLTDLWHDFEALRAGYTALVQDGETSPEDAPPAFDAALDLFNGDVYQGLLRLNENVQPCWHVRAWFLEAVLDGVRGWRKLCEPTEGLYDSLFDPLPHGAKDSLTAPDDLGFFVRPKQVPALRVLVGKRLKKLGPDLSRDHDNKKRSLISLHEALTYAEQQGLAFAERIC